MDEEHYLKARRADQLGSWAEGNPGGVDQTEKFLPDVSRGWSKSRAAQINLLELFVCLFVLLALHFPVWHACLLWNFGFVCVSEFYYQMALLVQVREIWEDNFNYKEKVTDASSWGQILLPFFQVKEAVTAKFKSNSWSLEEFRSEPEEFVFQHLLNGVLNSDFIDTAFSDVCALGWVEVFSNGLKITIP